MKTRKIPDLKKIEDLGDIRKFNMGRNEAKIIENDELSKLRRKIKEMQSSKTFPEFNINDKGILIISGGAKYIQVVDNKVIYNLRVTDEINGNGEEKTKIDILIGPCLFGAKGVIVTLEDRKKVNLTDPSDEISNKVKRIKINSKLTIYEIEYVYRVCSFIAKFINNVNKTDTIYLNLPKFEYYLYMLDAFNSNNVNSSIVNNWFDCVDKRVEVIEKLLKDTLLDLTGKQIEFKNIEPLEKLGVFLRRKINNTDTKNTITINDLKNELQHDKNFENLWWLFFTELNTVKDIIYTSYVIGYLKSLAKQEGLTNRILIAVENPSEEPIFRRIKDEGMKKINRVNFDPLRALYLERNFINSDNINNKGKEYELYFTPLKMDKTTEDILSNYYGMKNLGLITKRI